MKSYNALVSLACGDAYGNYFEKFGLRGKTFAANTLPDGAKVKSITDDTKMALILWNHYATYKTIRAEELLSDYQHWAEKDGYKDGIGIHTAEVLLGGKTDKNSQGNGALMRVIPFGLRLVESGYQFDDAVEMMNIDAALTHDNDVIKRANRLCLDIALNGLDVVHNDEYHSLLSSLVSGSTAWVIHTLYTVLDVLKMDLGCLDGFKEIVSRGGDTDTNCAIYGAIKGYRDHLELNIFDFLDTESYEKVKHVVL